MKSLLLTMAAETPQNRDMTGKQERRMVNCPSTVPTAKTSVMNRKGGVAVSTASAAAWSRARS